MKCILFDLLGIVAIDTCMDEVLCCEVHYNTDLYITPSPNDIRFVYFRRGHN
jgi:hypothetical protein